MKKHSTRGHNAMALYAGMMSLCLAFSTAHAAKPGNADVFDLDITKFRTTERVNLSSGDRADVIIELTVRNRSRVDGTGRALLVGRTIPGNSLVFNRWIFTALTDPPGGKGTTYSYTIDAKTEIDQGPSYGAVRWTVYVEDGDEDFDTAKDITVIQP